MDVIQAILSRHSVRDFDSKPIPKDILLKIFEAAIQSPSGGNSQPWEVFVASGDTVEKMRKIYGDRFQNAPAGQGGPPPMVQPPEHKERMTVIRNERFRLLGLDPDDPASGKVFMEWASRLFGAPVIAFVCMDKSLPPARSLNIGLFVQTVCLAAKNYGIDSFIAGQLLMHQDVLRQELDITEDYSIETGIALGYPKADSIINTYRSPRRPIDEVVRFFE